MADASSPPADAPAPVVGNGALSPIGRVVRDLSLFARGLDTLLDLDLEVQRLAERVIAAEAEVVQLRAANAKLTRDLGDVMTIAARSDGPLARRFASLHEVVAFVAAAYDPTVVHFHERAYQSAAAASFDGSLLQAWQALDQVASIAEAFHKGWLSGDPRNVFLASGGVYTPEIGKALATAHPDAYHVPWPEPDGPRRPLGPVLGALRDGSERPTLWIAWFKETTPHRRWIVGHVGDALPGRG